MGAFGWPHLLIILAVILLLGPAVDLVARLLSLDLHQAPEPQRAR